MADLSRSSVSGLAIISVLLPFFFVLPVLSGVGAIGLAVRARRDIAASEGTLRGDTLAVAGLLLGALHIVVVVVILALAIVNVGGDEVGIVSRDTQAQRELMPGVHVVTPILDEVKMYSIAETFVSAFAAQRYITQDKSTVHLVLTLDWRICDHATFVSMTGGNVVRAEQRLADLVTSELRIFFGARSGG
jgi:hypothetical protein